MDEPTSALTDSETETLFTLIEQLKSDGTGIVYISHRMDELRRLADRVSVLRDGHYIGSLEKSEISVPKIIEMMVGRVIDEGTRPSAREHQDEVEIRLPVIKIGRRPVWIGGPPELQRFDFPVLAVQLSHFVKRHVGLLPDGNGEIASMS